jgi:hypothetical protein
VELVVAALLVVPRIADMLLGVAATLARVLVSKVVFEELLLKLYRGRVGEEVPVSEFSSTSAAVAFDACPSLVAEVKFGMLALDAASFNVNSGKLCDALGSALDIREPIELTLPSTYVRGCNIGL